MRNLQFFFLAAALVTTATGYSQIYAGGTNNDVDWANLTSGTQCQITGQSVSEASNQIDWQRAWNKLTGKPGETAPRVYDFTRKKVVVITLGRRDSGGYSVFVTGIRRGGGGRWVIDATERTPAPGSYVNRRPSTPFTVVTVDKMASGFLLNLSQFEPQPGYDDGYGYNNGWPNRPTNPPITGNPNDNSSPVNWSNLTSSVRSNATRQELLVARNANDFRRVYGNLTGQNGMVAPGNIDWTREMVVFVTLGTRRTGGYSVFVKSLRSGPNGAIIVDAVERTPDPSSFVTQGLTSPWTAIKLDRTQARILLNMDLYSQ